MHDPLANWEHRIIVGGIRLLTIATFLAFLGWSLWHLVLMFGA
jgi:hypothetical protein